MGDIKDEAFRQLITANKNDYQRCGSPKCTMECDGYLVEQEIDTVPSLTHRGGKLTDYKLAGNDFCTLMIHLTAFCNMKCSYCSAQGWMEAYKGQDLSLDEWKSAVTFFTKSFGAGMVQVMGGEPTIKKGWEEIVRIFVDAGWQVELLTNLVKDKAVVDFIKSLPQEKRHLCLVYVSIHPTQQAFDPAKLMIAFFQLKSLGANFACSLVRTPENLRIAQEMKLRERVYNMGINWFGTVPDYGFAKF